MAWQLKDEWIDLAQHKHTVVYHNPDILVPAVDPLTKKPLVPTKMVPAEHHLINHYKMEACPTCGRAQLNMPADFDEERKKLESQLADHHTQSMQYREKHHGVRIGSGPKQ